MRDKFRTALFTAIGEASMCWSETPSGEFDSSMAKAAGDKVMEVFEEVYSKPWLGNATTAELLAELTARAEVGGYATYKTASG